MIDTFVSADPFLGALGGASVIDRGVRHDATALLTAADELARRVVERAAGTRVAALLPNSSSAVVAFLAAARAGSSYLPLNPALRISEVQDVVARADVRAILCSGEDESRLADVGVPRIAVDRGAAGRAALPSQLDPEREFVCLSTSGSTGQPRIAARSARAVLANQRHVSRALAVDSTDCFLSVVPFFHANGYSNCLVLPLLAGASLVTLGRFHPRETLAALLEHEPTIVIGSPFIFRALLEVLEPSTRFPHVRAFISSGAPLPEATRLGFRARGIEILQLYGSTETGTLSISEAGSPEGSVGMALEGVEVRIVDAEGRPVPRGETGELRVRSPALFRGYVGETAEPAPFDESGGYAIRDRGFQDASGRLHLLGRADAMINVAGNKVDPLEVQSVLAAIPGVRRCMVFGVPDRRGFETVKAYLVVERPTTTAEILAHARSRLSEYKLPRLVEFVDQLPMDLMGKLPKRLQ